jgi:hypothetical protein
MTPFWRSPAQLVPAAPPVFDPVDSRREFRICMTPQLPSVLGVARIVAETEMIAIGRPATPSCRIPVGFLDIYRRSWRWRRSFRVHFIGEPAEPRPGHAYCIDRFGAAVPMVFQE